MKNNISNVLEDKVTNLQFKTMNLSDKRSRPTAGMVSKKVLFLVLVLPYLTTCLAARVGGRGAKQSRRGRIFNSPMIVRHRHQSSVTYYENKDGARITKASHFELDYMLGRKITFFCMAQGLPRPEITWFKDGIELYAHKFFQVHEWSIGNDTLKSKMEIDPTTQKDAGYYECQANNKYAIDSRGFRTDYVMIAY